MSKVQRVVQIDQIAVGSYPPKRESHLRRKEIGQVNLSSLKLHLLVNCPV